jgi:ribose/xylose/arabinose/galactoside ABC-type transport system permease subunit
MDTVHDRFRRLLEPVHARSQSLFWEHHLAGVLDVMHHAMIATLAVSIAIAMVTRSARVAAWPAHPSVTAAGFVVGAVTVLLGLRLDVGPFFVTLAVLLAVASTALRRDRGERVRLTPN